MGLAYSAPTVTDNAIYITGRKGDHDHITAPDLTGKILWEKQFGE